MKGIKIVRYAMLGLTLVFALSCSRGPDSSTAASLDPQDAQAPPLAVEALTVTTGNLVPEIRGAGIARGNKEAWVVSETEGLVRSVSLNLGDFVTGGALLLSVDADLAERNRDLAASQLKTAQLEYEAAQKAVGRGSMSALQFSQTTDRLLAAEASEAAAAKAYENAFLRAPFNGVVAQRDGSVGIGTLLTRGVRVAKIVDDSSFRTEFSVGEGQVLLVQAGAAAQIRGGDGIIRSGRVAAVSAGSDDGTGGYTVLVEWTPEPDDPLRSGMTVDVTVEIQDSDPKVIIPVSAVRLREGKQYVFVGSDDTAEAREIVSGGRLGDRLEVLEGLSGGESLIVSGLASLVPGSPVSLTVVGESGEA